jgi:hypothetical protein
VTHVAGTGEQDYDSQHGVPALEAGFSNIVGLAFGADGRLYIADGITRRIAENGTLEVVDSLFGDIFVANSPGRCVVRYPSLLGETVAGSCFDGPEGGDGGLATQASLFPIGSLAADSLGNLYIGTQELVRKVDRNGIISTVAGSNASSAIPLANGAVATQVDLF